VFKQAPEAHNSSILGSPGDSAKQLPSSVFIMDDHYKPLCQMTKTFVQSITVTYAIVSGAMVMLAFFGIEAIAQTGRRLGAGNLGVSPVPSALLQIAATQLAVDGEV
jgi:hypothetical protein